MGNLINIIVFFFVFFLCCFHNFLLTSFFLPNEGFESSPLAIKESGSVPSNSLELAIIDSGSVGACFGALFSFPDAVTLFVPLEFDADDV